MLEQIIKEDIRFSVDGRLIKELGEKLVTKNYLALAELIKNSYDADSDNVSIKFNNVKYNSSSGTIVITDNGSGMTWSDFNDYWMRVSTSNKEHHPVSKVYGRNKSGSKGIGRFACQKLARSLIIETVSETQKIGISQVTRATVEWDDFVDGIDLIETSCKSERYNIESNKVLHGTTITLYNLRQDWNQRSYTNLQRQLASLSISSPVRRDGFKEDPGFDVFVTADEFESEDYKLSEKVLDSGWGRVTGSVGENGDVNVIFNGKLIGTRKHQLNEAFPVLKNASFDITFLPEVKAYQRNPQLMTLQQMKAIRELYSGVKVYSEGFRVYPYGQPGDDWLGLDYDVGRRKAKVDNNELAKIAAGYGLDSGRVLLDLFSNRSLIGSVKIDTNNNPEFDIKLNREGFVDNAASELLRKLLRYIVEWMTIQYSYFKFLYAEQEREEAERVWLEKLNQSNKLKDTDDSYSEKTYDFIKSNDSRNNEKFQKALSVILDEVKHSAETITVEKNSLLSPVDDTGYKSEPGLIEAASNFIQKEFDSNKKELTLLRAIASTGPLFFVFAHEFKSLVSHLDTDAGKIEQWVERGSVGDSTWLLSIAQSLRSSRKRFLSLENLIGVFASTHKTEAKKIKVKEALKKVCDGFEFITSGKDIRIYFDDIDVRLKTKEISDAAFYSILVNLVSNALKAVMAKGEREIRIKAWRDEKLVIHVEDKGIGLDEDKWNDVFLPLVTDPSGQMYKELYGAVGNDELAVLGRGTGLGLNIVKGMVNDNGGSVKFIPPSAGWSTCVEVRMP
ncbi:ATP-binding protein [Shewanella algae]|uniref:sensor histidine kinase n=1 Tax=Shewanella algae TaxID=38313 RepID=UPI001AAFB3A9|nr:ATP-binding protein [Shewanella algae]MBO2639303.1 ATP-binding protein [Shewanella algae]